MACSNVHFTMLCASCILFILLGPSWAQTLDQNIQLMQDKLQNYDRRFRPVLNQSNPIMVNVTFDLIALQDFDEVQEKISVIGVFYMFWYDEKLTWNPASYGNIYSQLYSMKDIWYPILVLTNPSKDLKDIVQDWMTIRVYFSGLAVFYPGAIFDATCSVDVTYYPFDIQTCTLKFVPWGIGLEEMILYSASEKVLQSWFSESGEWTFIELTAQDGLRVNNNQITLTFKLKRKPTFLLVNVILPIVFMAVISVFVFVLPPESGERISFSITVLLALAVFFTLISDNLPKTSKPLSHLSYFLTCILIYSVFMCIVAICNLRVYFKDENSPVPPCLVSFILFIRCKTCKVNVKRTISPQNDRKSHQNQVSVVDVDFPDKKERTTFFETEETPELPQQLNVAWKDVSATIDVACLVLFSLAIIITCAVYLHILTSNA